VDRFRTLSLLMKIVETGSMRAAGEALGISKSVISHEVNKLEERLGARLLYRNTRRLVPTEAGARFINRGRCYLPRRMTSAFELVGFLVALEMAGI